jgi:pilus assembly protein CpaB
MLIAGVVLAAISFIAVLAFGGFGQAPKSTPAADVQVVVANQDIALGSALTADQLATSTRPPAEAIDTYQSPNDVVGLVVRQPIHQGDVLTQSDFQSSVTLPQVVSSLGPGLRAIAVPLSTVDAVGALVQPGDFVDVLLSMEDTDGLNPAVINNPSAYQPSADGSQPPYLSIDQFVNKTTIKVVVQNVQVLGALPRDTTSQGSDVSSNGTLVPDVMVILAVTPQQAEVVRFAELDGHVSLMLRAPADAGAPDVVTTGITLHELVDKWGVLPPQPVVP